MSARLALTTLALLFSACATAPRNPWSEKTTISTGASEPIGGTDAGCLNGAVALPADGPGFEVQRISRRRYYAHPSLRDFLVALGAAANSHGYRILIGDLAMPRGGPFHTGHASHQTGLDADIWFRVADSREPAWDLDARENRLTPWVVTSDQRGPDFSFWGAPQLQILEMAASFEEVDRIFVNFALKRDLCNRFRGKPWLRKIRPWWGHQEHFHVRLRCPAGTTSCSRQTPIPEGDGCDATLDWWFTPEAQAPAAPASKESSLPRLPDACEDVLEAR